VETNGKNLSLFPKVFGGYIRTDCKILNSAYERDNQVIWWVWVLLVSRWSPSLFLMESWETNLSPVEC